MPPRGKIAQLPEALRAWLHRAIVERGYGDIVALTAELNALLREGGLELTVGKTTVSEESQRVRRAQEAIRATTEAARLIAQSAPDDGDQRSAAAMAIVQSEVFELLLQVRESAAIDDPVQRLEVLNKAALGMARLSRARVNQARWSDELQARTAAAAERVAKLARKGGMDARTVAEIRASILGILPREAAAAP